jgi:hypothetical protein
MRWQKIQDCPPLADCGCQPPAEAPGYVGQIVPTPCAHGSSSESSLSESSLSESSSDTPPADCGYCVWIGAGEFPYMYWDQVTPCPNALCSCVEPVIPPAYVGQGEITTCHV